MTRDEKPSLRKCESCKKYTLSPICSCDGRAVNPAPPKYSPDDKYAGYRRKYKEEQKSQ